MTKHFLLEGKCTEALNPESVEVKMLKQIISGGGGVSYCELKRIPHYKQKVGQVSKV